MRRFFGVRMWIRVERADVDDKFYCWLGKTLFVKPPHADDKFVLYLHDFNGWIVIPLDNCTGLNYGDDGVNEAGIKYDGDKLKAGCLRDFALALKEVVKVSTHGCEKYRRSDWLNVDNAIERYTDAQDRHALELWAGNEIDESGCLHEAQVIWNALAVLELKLRAKP